MQVTLHYTESKACLAALKTLNLEAVPPPGYAGAFSNAASGLNLSKAGGTAGGAAGGAGGVAGAAGGGAGGATGAAAAGGAAAAAEGAAGAAGSMVVDGEPEMSEDGVRLPSLTDAQLQWLLAEVGAM